MKHLFRNSDGELVAADTPQQATQYHDVELGGGPFDSEEWEQVPDDESITIGHEDAPKDVPSSQTMTAREWAESENQPAHIGTKTC